MARALIAVHRRLQRHPRVHALLASSLRRTLGERRVNRTILDVTRPGDCVWDVGANVGTYTRQLLERLGPSGHVVAFEPVPDNVAKLRALKPLERLTVVEAALAESDREMSLVVSGPNGETSHIGAAPGALVVRVRRGDSVLSEGMPQPDVLKIDVEGFERDVLEGMPAVLCGVREIVIEVHFAAMARRGAAQDSLRILTLLQAEGFTTKWIDSSHLLARRAQPISR